MTLPRALLLPAVLALLAACQGDAKSLDASSYDTSCQEDSDCTPVYFGPEPCYCEPLNGAINKSSDAKYLADLAAAAEGANCAPISCPAVSPVTAVCSKGTCKSTGFAGGI